MLKEFKTQFDVLKALSVYDLQGQMKSYNYGFAWVILEPLLYIGAFRLMRQMLGTFNPPSGMTPSMFYILGILPLYLGFEGLRGYTILAKPPGKMMAFPRVTPVDLSLASSIGSFAIYFALFWMIALPVSIYENVWPPKNLFAVMVSLIFAWMVGVSAGFVLAGAYRAFPPTKQFVSYLVFGLRVASGMFFCITMIPIQWWPYLSWNPLLQVTEMARAAWFESYVSPIASPLFIVECILVMTLLGLSMERYMRRMPYL